MADFKTAFLTYDMAVSKYFDGQGHALDEAVLFHGLPASVKLVGQRVLHTDTWNDPDEIDTHFWQELNGVSKDWPRVFITGWRTLHLKDSQSVVMRGAHNVGCVMHDDGGLDAFCESNFGDQIRLCAIAMFKADLYFRAENIDLLFAQRAASAAPQPALGSRERNNLLKLIDALTVIAKLKDRGAATPIAAQLEQLGYEGPTDDTIREVLKQARELRPKK